MGLRNRTDDMKREHVGVGRGLIRSAPYILGFEPLRRFGNHLHEYGHAAVNKIYDRNTDVYMNEHNWIPGGKNFVKYRNSEQLKERFDGLTGEEGGVVSRTPNEVANAANIWNNDLKNIKLDVETITKDINKLDTTDINSIEEMSDRVHTATNKMDELNISGNPIKTYYSNNPVGFTEDVLFRMSGHFMYSTFAGFLLAQGIHEYRTSQSELETISAVGKIGLGTVLGVFSAGDSRTDMSYLATLTNIPGTTGTILYTSVVALAGLSTGFGINAGSRYVSGGVKNGFSKFKKRFSNKNKSSAKKKGFDKSRKP